MNESQKMIHTMRDLTNLSRDELHEVLLDENYNKANLRELVRRLVISYQHLEEAVVYEQHLCNETNEKMRMFQRRLAEAGLDWEI